MEFFLLAFKHILIIVLILFELRVILNKIFGAKYHFLVSFPEGHVYNKVKQILLNSLNYTSLGSLFH